jgi:hypothetical protein
VRLFKDAAISEKFSVNFLKYPQKQRLKVANLKLKANKCFLFQTKIKYLGHVVFEEGVECDADKIVDARDWP